MKSLVAPRYRIRGSDFKALLPSWLFFDDLGAGCHVFWRSGDETRGLGEWQTAFAPEPRRVWHLLHNPSSNFRLFALSSFERLLEESQSHLASPSSLLESENYQICLRLLANHCAGNARCLQFRILARLADDPSRGFEEAFVSSVHEI